MSNQVAIVDDHAMIISEVEKAQKVSLLLMKTPHYAKMGPDGIFAILNKAKSLGMDQMEALNGGLYYVQGKVGMPAETMSALIRQKGHSIQKDSKSDDKACILHGKRADNGDMWTVSFSLEDARRAGLLKGMYDKYPATMLYNRAMSFLARQLFPDVIRGAGYTMDELREIADNSHNFKPTEQIQVLEEVVSVDQANELINILSECDDAYQHSVWNTLRKLPNPVDKMDQLPLSLFERIKNAARKKRDEYQSLLQEKPALESEELELEIANEA